MTTYGVTSTGFAIKPLDVIKAEIEADQRADPAMGPAVNQTADSVIGAFNGIVADKIYDTWLAVEGAYAAYDPDAAEGASLDQITALTGTTRDVAHKSQAPGVQVTLAATTTLPTGSVAHVLGDVTARFVSKAPIVNAAGTQQVVTGDFEAETAGPLAAPTGTLTVIAQPVTGWVAVSNPTDAIIGSNVEADDHLRLKREEELAAPGSSNLAAIVADVRRIKLADGSDGVVAVKGYENVDDLTDVDGRPPHSVEIVVLAPLVSDNEIAQVIYDSKSAGINTYSATADSGTATDADGNTYAISFSRATALPIFLAMELQVDASLYAGDTALKAALSAFAQATYGIAATVVYYKLLCEALHTLGVVDINFFFLGLSAVPTSGTSNIPLGLREYAQLDTANITIGTVSV